MGPACRLGPDWWVREETHIAREFGWGRLKTPERIDDTEHGAAGINDIEMSAGMAVSALWESNGCPRDAFGGVGST